MKHCEFDFIVAPVVFMAGVMPRFLSSIVYEGVPEIKPGLGAEEPEGTREREQQRRSQR